jgi:hypothetical protein
MKLSESSICLHHLVVAELWKVLLSCSRLVAARNLSKQVLDATTESRM